MFQAFGRIVGLIFGFLFLGIIVAILGLALALSLWLDTAGVASTATIVGKYEKISFDHADWHRTYEIGVASDVNQFARMRRTMIERGANPGSIGVDRLRVPGYVYDRHRVGEQVPVRVRGEGSFQGWPLNPQVRLADVTTASLFYAFFESTAPAPQFALTLLPAIVCAWLAAKRARIFWWASGLCFLLAMVYWLTPLSDERPTGDLAEAEGKVVALRLVETVGESSETTGTDALLPHYIVGIEFQPKNWPGPVVAVDRVDANSVDLKEGKTVHVEYQPDEPRRALLVNAERRWWLMNIVSVGGEWGLMLGLILACGLLSRLWKFWWRRAVG